MYKLTENVLHRSEKRNTLNLYIFSTNSSVKEKKYVSSYYKCIKRLKIIIKLLERHIYIYNIHCIYIANIYKIYIMLLLKKLENWKKVILCYRITFNFYINF